MEWIKRFRPAAVLAGLALSGGLMVAGPAAEAAFPGDNGIIAFSKTVNGNADIFTVDPEVNGSEVRRAGLPGTDTDPSISADGRQIAFVNFGVSVNGTGELFVVNIDGTNLRRITSNGVTDTNPAWTPDGRLVFARRDAGLGTFDLFIKFPAFGAQEFRLTSEAADEIEPAVSVNGTIAFLTNRDGDFEIFTNSTQGFVIQRTFNTVNERRPSWSPDGQMLAFEVTLNGNTDILTLETFQFSTGTRTNITPNTPNSVDAAPAWSPEGAHVAFHSNRDGDFEIFNVRVAFPDMVARRTSNTLVDAFPDWGRRPA